MSDTVQDYARALSVVTDKRRWSSIQAFLHTQQALHFQRGGLGGTFRGVAWSYFKPQYTRIDGTAVPVWGGVPRVFGPGMVQARLRGNKPGNKKRYASGDRLMQNTGILRNALLSDIRIDAHTITLSTPVSYARHQDALRPFNFLSDQDVTFINDYLSREISDAFDRL